MIFLSVVLPVRNEERFIRETLAGLIAQDYPRDRFELLVVDGMSTDGTREMVTAVAEENEDVSIRLLENPRILSSSGRNIGAREARGEYVMYVDGHVLIPDSGLFREIDRVVGETGALCLARPQPLLVPGLDPASTAFRIALARHSRLGHSTKSYIYSDHEGFVDPSSSGFAYHRSLFDRVGWYDENFDAAEDVEFNHRVCRAGISAYTSPRFLIYYYPRETYSALFAQQVRYGIGRARLVRKHPETFSIETLVPPALFLAHLAAPVFIPAVFRFPLPACLLGAALVLYWAAVCIAGFAQARKHGVSGGGGIALGIWTTHMGLGWGFLSAICRPWKERSS